MAMRTIPAMLGYARMVTEVAPDALIVNFTNPVGLIVQALTDHASARVVGVCDGPIGMKQSVAEFLGVPADEVHADYFGLNHAGWIHRVLVEGRDRLPEILDRYEELQRQDESWRLFDPELVRSLGMLPMEYLYFYYYRQQAVENIVASGSSRGEQIAALKRLALAGAPRTDRRWRSSGRARCLGGGDRNPPRNVLRPRARGDRARRGPGSRTRRTPRRDVRRRRL